MITSLRQVSLLSALARSPSSRRVAGSVHHHFLCKSITLGARHFAFAGHLLFPALRVLERNLRGARISMLWGDHEAASTLHILVPSTTMVSQVPLSPLLPDDIRVLGTFAMQIIVDLFLQGVQGALSLAAISALMHRGGATFSLTAAIIAMLLSSLVASIVTVMIVVIQLPSNLTVGAPNISDLLTRMNIVIDVMRKISLLASEIIVIWRAWVMYPDDRRVKILLSACCFGSIGGMVAHSVYAYVSEVAIPLAELMLPLPLLVTNGVTTLLISIRLWTYRRDIKAALSQTTGATRIENVLVLLAESGVVYCGLWGVYAFTLVKDTAPSYYITPYGIVSITYHHIAGIYITLVVFVLALQKDTRDSINVSALVSRALHFASAVEKHSARSDDSAEPSMSAESVHHAGFPSYARGSMDHIGSHASYASFANKPIDADGIDVAARRSQIYAVQHFGGSDRARSSEGLGSSSAMASSSSMGTSPK